MSIFNYKKIINYSYIILIVSFSFFINWKYSKYGVFPIDTFLHYDSAYRILNGEYPIKDYWIVSGFFVDFLQAFFFKIFGVNWYSYILHSSLLNVLISILTFNVFVRLNLKKEFAFFYSISFSALAYSVSGTPFVDLHATFFCIIAVYFSFFAVNKPDKYLNWFLVVSFYFFAFLSKQVPTTYIIILNGIVILSYLLAKKKLKPLLIIFLSLLINLLIFLFSLSLLGIELNNFYLQYLEYPRFIGAGRLSSFSFSVISFISNYKFILVPLILLFFIKTNKIIKKEINFFSSESTNFLIFFTLCIALFLHQLLTKNQIYIYFLIPLSFAFLQIEIKKLNLKYKNKFNYLIIFLVIFSTIKYHIKYNENRSFHELSSTNISEHTEAASLDKSLEGIMWVSPFYKGDPQKEIEMLKKVKLQLNKKKNIMLLTNYLFLDSITGIALNSPNRAHTFDGTTMPKNSNYNNVIIKNKKYFNHYKNFLYKKLKTKKINKIYFIESEDVEIQIFTQFFPKNCYVRVNEGILYFLKLDKSCLN